MIDPAELPLHCRAPGRAPPCHLFPSVGAMATDARDGAISAANGPDVQD
jgi:hypothetical protein